MRKRTELTIEQLEIFEERLCVRLEGLYASISENNYITLNGELHSIDRIELEQSIKLMVSAHDTSGRIIGTAEKSISAKFFHNFEIFSLSFQSQSESVSRVRIYPRQTLC
jgi:hypothetical protein